MVKRLGRPPVVALTATCTTEVAQDIVTQLHRETVEVLAMPQVKEAIGRQGGEINTGGPAEFGALIKADLAKWKRVVKEADIKVD